MQIFTVESISSRALLANLANDDSLLIIDASDGNSVKRVALSVLKAFIGSGSPSPTPTPTPTPNTFALRINCGGGAYTDPAGKIWSANIYQTEGDVFTRPAGDTVNSPLQTLYLSEAYLFKYVIPLSNGNYTVALHFAEFDHPVTGGNGQRRFDVLFNNSMVLPDYSIFDDVGIQNPAIKAFQVTIANGSFVISSTRLTSNYPKICAIEILGQ